MRRATAVVVLLCLFGCRPGHKTLQPKPPPPQPPAALNTRGINIRWREKTKSGGVQKVLDIQADTGNLDHETESGRMNGARGTLYRDDKPRASFTAPVVEASKDRKTVTVKGGVKLDSIDPVGISVSAAKATWQVEKNKIVLEGDVEFARTPPGAISPDIWGGPFARATVNTELERVHIP